MKNVFTANFRTLMTAGDWNQTETARHWGISQSLVSRYISGVTKPPRKSIESVAYRLGVPAESLVKEPLTLAQARRLLRRKPSLQPRALLQPPPAPPCAPWMRSLKRRWKSRPQKREAVSTALRTVFAGDYKKVVAWLNEG
jgi:transcriptional regulator with XRE-family HTH domain